VYKTRSVLKVLYIKNNVIEHPQKINDEHEFRFCGVSGFQTLREKRITIVIKKKE